MFHAGFFFFCIR